MRFREDEVAGGVVEEHVLAAGVAGVDARRVRAGVPVVDGGVELHARVAALPGRLGHHLHEVAGPVGRRRRRSGEHVAGLPLAVLHHRAHELVGDAHGVVGVLEEDGVVGPALHVEGAVVAGVDEGPGLALLFGLAVDELVDVGVVGVQDHHLGGAAGLAPALDHAGEGVVAAHEGDGTGGGAAAGQRLLGGADAREVRARARAELEEHALGLGQAQDRLHRVVDGVDEAGRGLRVLLDPDVEPDRAVEGRLLLDEQVA